MLMPTMRVSKIILSLALVATVCHSMPAELSRQKRVIGGDQYTKGEFPYHVSLWFMGDNPYTEKTPDLHHTCGGSLVEEQWVLTAAICFDDRVVDGVSNLTMWEVYLGMYAQTDAMAEAQYRMIEEIFIVPEYNLSQSYGDLALLKLNQPADLSDSVGLVKINIDPKCPEVDDDVELIGWGQTQNETFGLGSDVPYKATVKVTSTEYCHDAYSPFAHMVQIDEGVLCAGLPEGGVDGCNGDSGSPLLAPCGKRGSEGQQVIVGTQSYGYGCARPGYPGVYTRVSTYSDWIIQTIKEN